MERAGVFQMCTAVYYRAKDHFFGRTLDIEKHYGQQVILTPRHYPFSFRRMGRMEGHYALLGMGIVAEGYPLYFEACNEQGLAMAGLNFPGNAHYFPEREGAENVSPFELIPWVLGQCRDIKEAKGLLDRLSLCDLPFGEKWPLSPLHWLLGDSGGDCITVECMRDGLHVTENPVGVLTNNPPFSYHMTHLCDYLQLSRLPPINRFGVNITPYSRGMGAMGLPGDASSASRFIRAAFVKEKIAAGKNAQENVNQFFHVLQAVEQPLGCVQLADGQLEFTDYACCMHLEKGVYYYKTYENSGLSAVDMHRENLEGNGLKTFPLHRTMAVHWQNESDFKGSRLS